MKIGLIDVDNFRRAKVKGVKLYPNLALCKIASYHKQRGDIVEWASQFEHYDIIYRAKVFRFTSDLTDYYSADKVISGGTGYNIHSQLPQEIDDCQPDLSIYPGIPQNTSYGFLSRGCPNHCKWCVVHEKEGAVRPYWDIDRVANGNKNIILMDNNIVNEERIKQAKQSGISKTQVYKMAGNSIVVHQLHAIFEQMFYPIPQRGEQLTLFQ